MFINQTTRILGSSVSPGGLSCFPGTTGIMGLNGKQPYPSGGLN
jgi:hypothetical protein